MRITLIMWGGVMLRHQLSFPGGDVLYAKLLLCVHLCSSNPTLPATTAAHPARWCLGGGDSDGSGRANASALAMASAGPTLPCLMPWRSRHYCARSGSSAAHSATLGRKARTPFRGVGGGPMHEHPYIPYLFMRLPIRTYRYRDARQRAGNRAGTQVFGGHHLHSQTDLGLHRRMDGSQQFHQGGSRGGCHGRAGLARFRVLDRLLLGVRHILPREQTTTSQRTTANKKQPRTSQVVP